MNELVGKFVNCSWWFVVVVMVEEMGGFEKILFNLS